MQAVRDRCPEDALLATKLFAATSVIAIAPVITTQFVNRSKTPAKKPFSIDAAVLAAAQEHQVDPKLVKSIIAAESAFQLNAVSNKGAIGLMQLTPQTGQELGYDITDSEQNVKAGSKYLRFLLSRYKGKRNALPMAIAAYNAGPGNVERYRGVPPFAETRTYVKRVLRYLDEYRRTEAAEAD